MARGQFVTYLQGTSGPGLEAQRRAVADFLNADRRYLVTEKEVVEAETGRRAARTKLAEAIQLCRRDDATLVIAELARRSDDVYFLRELQRAKVHFTAVDMPGANMMMIGTMIEVAQAKSAAVLARTKAALAAAKKRGVKLGGPTHHHLPAQASRAATASATVRSANAQHWAETLAPDVAELRAEGATSLRKLATGLNRRGITTRRGAAWTPTAVQRVLERIEG
ncbi:Site-specific DNA recombinase [Methylobacterium sp. ap11]|uniref:recombinase family protein n=1 Tax=Methylobacterium sp. ap11 TaxID=1761799 RepID=UPI0008C75588|nr:recombinase family protein [Methylobacterium sp. ap11]SEP40727.1 Site-specific DNA recombinase [Methylobacterium sp. ap11]